jgi:hypothetical protein
MPLTNIPVQQKNPWTKIHMYTQWRKVVPQKFWEETCPEPTKCDWKEVKTEGKKRGEMKEWKKKQKRRCLDEVQAVGFWGGWWWEDGCS